MKFNKITAVLIVIVLASIAFIFLLLWVGNSEPHITEQSTVPVYGYKKINIYPHDTAAYTQGLVYDGQDLYESTGLHGKSTVRQVELETGKIQ